MNEEDRQKIDLYCDIAVGNINIINLWPKLVENKIFNIDDVNISTWKKNFDKKETVRNIWLTIKTRGPSAFQGLLLSLRQSSHEELADLLDKHAENSLINSLKLCNDDYYRNIKEALYPLKIKVKKDKSRWSATQDQANLKKMFEEMGFFVEMHCNLTGQEIKDCVTSFSRRKELLNVDSCFIIVSSHGNGPGRKGEEDCTEISGVDNYTDQIPHGYTKVFCSDVIDCFTSEACPYLAGKPKIFIFQLCRGNKTQTKTITTSKIMPKQVTDLSEDYMPGNNSNVKIKKKVIRNYSDMLIAYATLPGHVAFRNNVIGSWFILIFCEVFMNHAYKDHVCDLFKIIDSRLRKVTTTEIYCQTISLECKGFHKYCYINPGVFE
ncbi:caspase Dronc-like isoform X2 [Polistes fuscatus]|uniref:caspase Dronc-like isoform X2 n=1 Tax=Polistes fuscatus TaxID=30207 RepID=UPI001CA8B0CD|nr:caspase Dronc-like isoform X2 [Polistes fuscatus]